MVRAIGIGDSVCDKYLHLGMMFPGGQALNFAVYCRLAGNEAAFIGVNGDDAVGRHLQAVLSELGVDMSHTRQCSGESGYAVVDMKDGERFFVTSNKGGVLRTHPIVLNQDDLDYISSFDLIHTSNNSYMDSQLPALARLPGLLSYDFSRTWNDEARMTEVCRHVDFCFLSCSDMGEDEVRNVLIRAHETGCAFSVATMGKVGALGYDGVGFYEHRPKPVEAIDTLGAGDSFAAGFMMEYADSVGHAAMPEAGSDARRRIVIRSFERGALLSAKTCMTQGAFGYGTTV